MLTQNPEREVAPVRPQDILGEEHGLPLAGPERL